MKSVKDEILETCLNYFLQHGVRKMSNDKLVALLGISTKTLYKHFKDKENLISQALDLHYSQQRQLFESLAREESAPVFLFKTWHKGFEMEFKVNKTFYRDLHYYYPGLEKKVETRIVKKIWKELDEIINTGKEEGTIRKDILPEVVLESISVLYVSIVRKGEFKKFNLSPEKLLLNTIAAYVRGICTEKGVTILDKHIAQFNRSNKENSAKKEVSTTA